MYVFMVSGISLLMFIVHYVYTTTVRKVSEGSISTMHCVTVITFRLTDLQRNL
jgi:hypothetical protein